MFSIIAKNVKKIIRDVQEKNENKIQQIELTIRGYERVIKNLPHMWLDKGVKNVSKIQEKEEKKLITLHRDLYKKRSEMSEIETTIQNVKSESEKLQKEVLQNIETQLQNETRRYQIEIEKLQATKEALKKYQKEDRNKESLPDEHNARIKAYELSQEENF